MISGHLQLQRRFFSHWLWAGDDRAFSRAEAFLDLLQLAAFTHTKKLVQGTLIQLSLGQVCGSERYLAGRWRWSTCKVRAFLTLLEADQVVTREKKQGSTVITLCNYDTYNGEESKEKARKKQRESRDQAESKRIEEGEEGGISKPPLPPGGDGQADESKPTRCLPEGWSKMPLVERKRVRVLANTPLMERIGRLFGRGTTTLWTIAEAVALKQANPSPDEVDLIAGYYSADLDPDQNDYRRRDIGTLLNNWTGEMDRARLWRLEHPDQ